jgi:hypothetical protein
VPVCFSFANFVPDGWFSGIVAKKQLASLLHQQKLPTLALEIVDKLLVELKKLDDKQMLTETHLTEARIYHSLQNIPKGNHLISPLC